MSRISFLAASYVAALMTPMLFAPDAETSAASAAQSNTEAAKKSIVPAKYAGKYRGAQDDLAKFIDAQCQTEGKFDYDKFFTLCKSNGLDVAKVDHYQSQVAQKLHGSQGRARMTLRNMLATIVRKDGKLKGLDGAETGITIAKPALTGAAAKAHETAQTAPADQAETSTTETEGDAGALTGDPDPVETQSSDQSETA